MHKVVIAVVGIILILGGLAFYYSNQAKSRQSTDTQSTPQPSTIVLEKPDTIESSPSGTEALKAGGSSYVDPQGIFSFLYPNDYKQDLQNQGKIVRVFKQGPTQKGQTEMYDGVIITFEAVSLDGKTLSEWTDSYISEQTGQGTSEVTEPKAPFTLNNYKGFSFKLRGLGEFQFHTLQKDPDSENAVLISTMVADPANAGFHEEVNNILASLQILK